MDPSKFLKSQWDRTAAVALSVIGALFLLFGWIGVSGTAYLADQAPYIVSGGVGGIFFLGLGATLWISADLRDEWRKLDRIEEALGNGTLRWADDSQVAPSPLDPPAGLSNGYSNGHAVGVGYGDLTGSDILQSTPDYFEDTPDFLSHTTEVPAVPAAPRRRAAPRTAAATSAASSTAARRPTAKRAASSVTSKKVARDS